MTNTADCTATDMFASMTGFDEIAVRRSFGANITDYARKDGSGNPMAFARALIFTHRRHEGDKDPAAYKAAMEATVAQVNDYFLPDPEDQDDDLDDEDAEGEAPSA